MLGAFPPSADKFAIIGSSVLASAVGTDDALTDAIATTRKSHDTMSPSGSPDAKGIAPRWAAAFHRSHRLDMQLVYTGGCRGGDSKLRPRRMSTGSVASQTWTLAGKITPGPSTPREQPPPRALDQDSTREHAVRRN